MTRCLLSVHGIILYALVIGLFCGRWALMALDEVDCGLIDWVNRKVYNMPHQMTARTDKSDSSRYSPAYATGRSAFVEIVQTVNVTAKG